MEWEIQNIVASVTLPNTFIPLEKAAIEWPEAEYNPEQFPGLVLKLKNPKVSALLFSSGKVIITGAKSMNDIKKALDEIIKKLEKLGVKVGGEPKIEIQNMVASGKLDFQVNLEELAEKLPEAEYEPEQFPGLIYRPNEIKVRFLIFKNGKIVVAGAKSEKEIEEAIKFLEKKLREVGAIRE